MAQKSGKKSSNNRKRTGTGSGSSSSSGGRNKTPAKRTTSARPAGTTKPSGGNQKPMTKYQKRRARRKKALNYSVGAIFVIIVAALAFIFLFRIGEIRIIGSTRYSSEQIVSASNLKIGDNTITSDKKEAADLIPKVLPFIETVKVKVKSPTVIVIEVTEAVPSAVYQTPEGYVLLSSKGKILETGAEGYLSEVPIIKGVSFKSYQTGAQAQYAEGSDFDGEDIKRVLDELFIAIAKYNFDIRVVDWTKPISLKLNYAETLIIDLGYPENIDAKLLAAKFFVQDSLENGEKGILRVSDPDNMSFTFDPNNVDLAVNIGQTSESEAEGAENDSE